MTLEELLGLFPTGVLVEVATLADENEELLCAEERALMSAMVPSRRKEFTAGRNTARRVLAQLGVSSGPLLRRGADRDIAWPAGVTGSISHTKGLVAVAGARVSEALQSVGLDVEEAGPLGDDIVATICRDDELASLAGTPAPWPSDWPRLLFAMKEAAYKAWFPASRREISFQQMRIAVDAAEQRYEAHVEGDGARISGRLAWDGLHVAAGAVIARPQGGRG